MSNDPDKPVAKPAPAKAPKGAKEDAGAPAAKPKPAAPDKLPPFEERRLTYAELVAHSASLDPDELIELARDGRAVVRANVALALAAAAHPAPPLATMLRDNEPRVAAAAAEAITKLGPLVRPLVPQITQALDGAPAEAADAVVATFADLVGQVDEEMIQALDVPLPLAMKSIVAACKLAGKKGVAFLIRAAASEKSKSRVNAIAGLGSIGKIDPEPAMDFLTRIEASDPIPDIRTAAKQAMLQIVAREKTQAVDSLPKHIPDFEERKLSLSELSEYTDSIDVDQMMHALQDGRAHVRINAARSLAVKGAPAGRAATAMGLLMRDSVAAVRREVAKALGKLGEVAIPAAPDLVGALSDAEAEVADEALEALAPLGDRVLEALVRGLETGNEDGGKRVGDLISRLPGGADALTEAFRGPAVNVQVNAAYGLGLMGNRISPAGRRALEGARTGGDIRTRNAVRLALDMLDPRGPEGPMPVSIDGFEERYLTPAEVDKHKAEIERVGVGDFTMYLQDGRDVVRANAAAALGVLGAAAAPAARPLGVLMRDPAARVRLASAQALDRIGDASVIETADDIVGALGDIDEKVAATCQAVLRARKGRVVGALLRGLETDNPIHGRRIVEVINVLPDASEILCDAFESPAVNVQVNVALGLGLLGPDRVGKGRKKLEGARTGGWERTRIAVRAAIELLDGPRRTGPTPVEVEGFETKVLPVDAFANAGNKLRVDDLIQYAQDGRPVVRANAATALGTLGPAAMPAVRQLGVLCRDDDMRVRIQAAGALDKLGDEAVREVADFLVGALRGDAEVAKVAAQVLAARKAKVLGALVRGLETDDPEHGRRINEVIIALPDACEILCDAFERPAENTQVNAALGIGMLGPKRAGTAGRKALEGARTGGYARTRDAVFKALAMLDGKG